MSALLMNLQVVLCCAYVTNALLSLVLAASGRNFRGAWLWVLAQSLMALGTIADALPADVPSWIPLILGNSAYAAACLCYSHSVWVFRFRRKFNLWLYTLIPLQLLSFLLAYRQPYLARAVAFSIWMSLGSLSAAILLLWKVERRFWLANTLTALPFSILGLASLSRVFLLATISKSHEVSSVSEQNIWYTTGAILLSTIMLFGYFMMTAIRTIQVLNDKDREIEIRNQKLIEAARAKDLFFALVAHDLRGPIGGAARYVRKHLFEKMSGLEAKYAQVEALACSLDKTNEFLEKLLWWSRTQLEDWIPAKNAFSIEECLAQSIDLVKTHAELKQITITVEAPPYPEPCADPESAFLIISNLLSNAIKYSNPGQEVRILVRREASFCKIIIEDHGIGMELSTIERLFRIEHKLTTLGTSQELGNGLGLILAKGLAERNGGKITIESDLGHGTSAILWLPLAP